MRFSKTAGRLALLIVFSFILGFTGDPITAIAKTSSTAVSAPSPPDENSNPMLATLAKDGAKFFYLGTRSGLDGWLIVKSGQVQIAYTIAGSHDVIIGALFGADGENITSQQVEDAVKQNKDIVVAIKQGLPQQQQTAVTGTPIASSQGAAATTGALSLGEQLIKALGDAKGVTLGSSSAPLVFMVMDPNCPHCRATWKLLRRAVFDKKLQLRMIPIATEETDNERAAGQLLHAADPLTSWDKYVSGNADALAGTPDATQIAGVRANDELISDWHIDETPWLVYRAKSGEIKIIKGELQQAAPLLADLP